MRKRRANENDECKDNETAIEKTLSEIASCNLPKLFHVLFPSGGIIRSHIFLLKHFFKPFPSFFFIS